MPLDNLTIDIFTIDNPEFEKYTPDIYPTELKLYKANTLDKERHFCPSFKYTPKSYWQ